MMEIKFKAWDRERQEMQQPKDIVGLEGETTKKLKETAPFLELIQYTNWEDIDGIEAFHWDICSHGPFYRGDYRVKAGVGYIQWVEDGWALVNAKKEYICGLFNLFKNYGGKIIGNIYENPGLLV